jgi:hypothetical protein
MSTTQESEDTATCGKGIAANAALPATLSELMAALADVFARHTDALNRGEAAGRAEYEAYASLERGHREVAAALGTLADEMRGYRDLPMAEHDMAVMADPGGQAGAYAKFLAVKAQLREMIAAEPADTST